MARNKHIPEPSVQPSTEITELTALEIAKLPPSNRTTILYERQLSELKEQNQLLISHLGDKEQLVKELSKVKSEQDELHYTSTIHTALITIGGACLGLGGKNWVVVGWTLLIAGLILSFFNRTLIMSLFSKIFKK